MENFTIINYDEGIFELNEKLADVSFKDKKLKIGFSPTLKCENGKNIFGIKIDVGYMLNEERLLTYGMAITIIYDRFAEILKQAQTNEEINLGIIDVWKSTISFIRGALCVKTQNTKLKSLILPDPNYDLFVKRIEIDMK